MAETERNEGEAVELDAAKKLIISAAIASCECDTKSPEAIHHLPTCRYWKLMAALDHIEDALEESPNWTGGEAVYEMVEELRAAANLEAGGPKQDLFEDASAILLSTVSRLSAAEAKIAKQAAEIEHLRKALTFIRLRDWGWKGGGSKERVPGPFGTRASKALGVASTLPDGWPDVDEYKEIRAALAEIGSGK